MRLRTLHHPTAHSKINVTPLIDVVMVLIVFYLIVGRLAQDRQARVDLPGAAVGSEVPGGTSLTITVASHDGHVQYLIDGQEVAADALESSLRALVPDAASAPPVQVRADRALPYGSVAPVIAACRSAGLTSVRLVAQHQERK